MTYESSTSFQIPELYYTALFEAMPGNSILLQNDTPKFTILAATPEYLAQTGQAKEAIIGSGFFEVLAANKWNPKHQEGPDLFTSFQHVVQHKAHHFLAEQRYDLVNDDGSFTEKYRSVSSKPVFAPDGEVAYIIHTSEDMTEQIRAKLKANESEEALKRFKFMADNAQDPFILMRQDGSFAYLNPKALEAWGYREEEVKNIRVPDVDPIYQDDAFAEVFARAQRGEVLQFETLHKRKGGHIYPVEVNMNGITLNGIPHLFAVARNITDRKRAEEVLRESESRFRSMIEQAPVAIALTRGADMIFESINLPMLKNIDRKSKDDIVGKKLVEALPELANQPIFDILTNVLQTGETFRGNEVPAELNIDGILQQRYFNLSYSRIVEASGESSVMHMSVDVTEQVLARKKIEESEGRFRLLADASPNLIWMLNPDGAYKYVNKTTLHFLGITQEQMAECGWAPFQHPDDLEATAQAVTKAIQNCQPYEMEHRQLHKSGEYRWVLSKAIPAYDVNGNVYAYVGSSIDIHEAKKSRQELQTALEQVRLSKEAAELGTFDMDVESGGMHWDDRCRTLFGISHHLPVSFDEDFIKRLHPDDQERVLEVVHRSFDKSLSNGNYDVDYRTIGAEDGVLRWVRAKGKVYFNGQEKPVRFIGSVLDITAQMTALQKIEQTVEERTRELAQANENLHVINKELQRSNQNLEEFAHAASHDMKEPIRKIHFFTHQLREQLSHHLNEAEIRSFSRIENATQRMGNLIDDLLLYSHVSQRPHDTEAVDLNEKVQRVLEDLELDIEEKKAVVHVGKLPRVQGYRRQLQQLFQNLISNSLKYSKAGEAPKIDITAKQVERSGMLYHTIKVSDNGIGFEQQYAEKIFQMFSRLHGKAEYSGTGVGLSIVKKVVENHDGFIEVESKPGVGSTFVIYLSVKCRIQTF